MKQIKLLIIGILIGLFSIFPVMAQEGVIDPDIPDSWYEEPKLASEMGIEDFSQAPEIEKEVEEGELPPVEERLPKDPPIIEPYEEIGKYGGTATIWSANTLLYDMGNISYFTTRADTAGRVDPEANIKPHLIKGWEYEDDYKKIVLHLREGLKWSDGHPVTAEDYIYWWEHEANNDILHPTPPESWNPPIVDVTKRDDFTVEYSFGKPAFNVHLNFQHQMGPGVWDLPPAHYMEQFHPDIVGEDKVVEMAEEVGLERWEEFYDRIKADSPMHPEYEHNRPVLRPYLVVERSETSATLKPNPYFPFVDPEGKQLPYIETIRNNLANNDEMAIMKASTGEATLAARNVMGAPSQIPLFKKNESEEDFRTLIYHGGDTFAIHPNLSITDPKMKDLHLNANFRRAVSLAIDREEINEKIFYEYGIPAQSTVIPLNELYKEEYAEAYAEYDPERAEELLDKIGMVDQNEDGYRETPDGEKYNPTYIFHNLWEAGPISELIRGHLEDIGINLDIKQVSRELYDNRWGANEGEWGLWPTGSTYHNYTLAMLNNWTPVEQGTPGSNWPGFVNWYTSDGEEGVEPPSEVKNLMEWAETSLYELDENKRKEATKKILESQAENIWRIGVISQWPRPIIASNKLRNVTKKGYLDNFYNSILYTNPEQFYLEE